MSVQQLTKIIGFSIFCSILVCILSFKPIYQDSEHKGHIGYLSPDNPDASPSFERCSEKLPIGFYHSAAPHIYNGGKYQFRKFIESNFPKKNYSDNGLLNFRFLIDCNGNIGDIETNQLNFDFEPIELNQDLVDELYQLSFRAENWNSLSIDEPRDIYMYLIYRIENGKVVEIIP